MSLDCACLIHGDRYDWRYVEILLAMVSRNLSAPLRFHVFTESHRSVPNHMIKHNLLEWPQVSGTKKAWWYKMQMFDPRHGLERVLYFDLDVVIAANLDWLLQLDSRYFWAIRDWRYMWRQHWQGINSSVMFWHTMHASQIWNQFQKAGLENCLRSHHGDQDFINAALDRAMIKHFDDQLIQSWRWQVLDGGLNTRSRQYHRPSAGAVIGSGTSVIVFHGRPKPHEIQDPVINALWC